MNKLEIRFTVHDFPLSTLDLYLSRIGAPLCSIFYTYLLVASSGTSAEERVAASAGESSVDPEMNGGMDACQTSYSSLFQWNPECALN